jgi:hypothetical protein
MKAKSTQSRHTSTQHNNYSRQSTAASIKEFRTIANLGIDVSFNRRFRHPCRPRQMTAWQLPRHGPERCRPRGSPESGWPLADRRRRANRRGPRGRSGTKRTLASADDTLAASHARLATDQVALFLALGGGWGAFIAVAVSLAGARLTTSVALQIAVAIAVCATIARERPHLRVCMWTAPIVLLTMQPGVPILINAAYRASEVILGALI